MNSRGGYSVPTNRFRTSLRGNMSRFLLLALALAAAAVAAITVAIPCHATRNAKSYAPPFSITISGPADVKVGSEIEVRVQITNTSAHDISAGSFYVDGVDTAYEYDVRNSAGELPERKTREMAGSIK